MEIGHNNKHKVNNNHYIFQLFHIIMQLWNNCQWN